MWSLLQSVPDSVCVCCGCGSSDVGVSIEGIPESALGDWPGGWFAFFCFDCGREWRA